MDNNAFRALVNEQRSQKSTKEIAREAVENEFRQKKKQRGGGGGGGGVSSGRRGRGAVREYDSDSGSDENDDLIKRRRREEENETKKDESTTNEPEWKRRRKEQKGATAMEYRDRARERREGKNLDYNEIITTTIRHNNDDDDEYTDRRQQAELSKFLGGDEQHTHLVKGLDLALARKVRREEMGGNGGEDRRHENDEDLDQLLEDAYAQSKKTTSSKSTASSKSSSSSISTIQPKSELGKSVLNYLIQQQRHNNHATSSSTTTTTTLQQPQSNIQINPTKQKSIQRTNYTFSLDSNIQKRTTAWDIPQLKIGALFNDTSSRRDDESLFESRRGMTPLDSHLIATIKKKLDDVVNNGVGKKKKGMVNGVERVEFSDNGTQQQQQQPSSSLFGKEGSDSKEEEQTHQDDNNNTHNSKAPVSSSPPATTNNKKDDKEDSDSDDDIFANVGAYVPPTAVIAATATSHTTAQSNNDDATNTSTITAPTKKQSIFDNLIATDQSTQKQPPPPPLQLQQHHHQHNETKLNPNKHVIDRDVFGGTRKQQDQQQLQQQVTRRRGPQTAAMEGVSMTNYEGGYGEEMDTDFLNEEEDYRRKKRRDDDEGGMVEKITLEWRVRKKTESRGSPEHTLKRTGSQALRTTAGT